MFNNTRALQKEDKENVFTALKSGSYILRNSKVELGETDEKEWNEGVKKFVPTGRKIPQLTVVHDVFKHNGSNEIENVKGEVIVGPTLRSWINDQNLGWNKKQNLPQAGRAVLTASLGVAPDGPIEFGDPVELLNKKFECIVRVNPKSGRNELMDIAVFKGDLPGVEDVDVTEEGRVKKN